MSFFRFICRIIDFVLLPLLLVFIYAWRIEPRWVEWNNVNMPTYNLPDHLIGKTIIQISDIHIGDVVNDSYIISQFDRINERKPDIVVYTGDFISAINKNQAPYTQLEHILNHKATGKLATIAILGNHDYSILARNSTIADSIENMLVKYGVTVLRNNAIDIQGLNIIGIDDYWGTNFNAEKALSNVKKDQANLVLCHNPDVVDLPIWQNYRGWILSGHTHGGQVRIPFGKTIRIPVDDKSYDEGLKQIDSLRTLYINRGLGHSIRIRFNARPEITQFTLSKKQLK